ncbi:hypothetical protein [Hymenobacter sp.]|uniref:hypothetical protein n=1 Tax=Hymenobacter sp. TaxID=1898978 RepID=UPI00286A1CD7|nr:hypothetical protein [Hymenobacter sp.]
MATEIKAIKCPQCGSPQKTEVKPDYYRCENCRTEYFLDNDRLTVHHTHAYLPPVVPPAPPRYALVGSVVVATVIIIAGLAVSQWLRPPAARPRSPDARAALATDDGYSAFSKAVVPLADDARQPVLLLLAARRYRNGGEQDGVYASFYDPVRKREIKTQRLAAGRQTGLATIAARVFSNGARYVIVNKTTIYEVDKAARALTNVGERLFQGQPALQAGVATVDFVEGTDGDGLSLFTNDGQNLFFYPLINRTYTAEELHRADGGFGTLLPGATAKTYYAFTAAGADCPGKIQLLEIKYLDNGGGPKDLLETVPCTRRNLGFDPATNRDAYQTELLGDAAKAEGRITAFRDLTPDRRYFAPKVLYSDAERLLISCYASADPQAPLSLQSLDPATGRIQWTTPLPGRDELLRVSPCSAGLLAATSQGGVLLTATGKIISQFTPN